FMETKVNDKKNNVDHLISATDLAKERNVSRKTIYNWLEDGKIKQVDYLGKKLFDKSTIKGVKTQKPGSVFVPYDFINDHKDMDITSIGFMVTLLGLYGQYGGCVTYDRIV